MPTQNLAVMSHYKPFPELLTDRPGTYEILDANQIPDLPTTGMVDAVSMVMVVPFDEAGRMVVRHEYAHVLWSPETPARVRGYRGYLQAVEDARINRGLRWIGLGLDLDTASLARVVKLGERDLDHGAQGLFHWALRCVAAFGTNAEQPLLALVGDPRARALPFRRRLPMSLSERVREVVLRTHAKVERARRAAGGPVCEDRASVLIARWLRRELAALRLPEPEKRPGLSCCFGSGEPLPGGLRHKLRGHTGLAYASAGAGGPGAGRMHIATPARPHRCATTPRGPSRGRRAASEGVLMRNIWRYGVDYKVFAERSRRHRGGAAVLIDSSGSMRLSPDDIDALIASSPEATLVAIYSGREGEGELRIVVKDGYRVSPADLAPYGHANVVDQPALEWLARQPGPRIWISDGKVTGRNDRPSRTVKQACAEICRRGRITRVDSTAEAVALLEAGLRRAA